MAKDQDIWLYRYSVSPATFFITASLLFCCWGRRLHLWPKWLHTELTQDQFTKKNLMFKVHLLRSDRVYPVIQSRLSVQISPHGSLTVRGLSELICQKVGGKKNSSVGHQSTWGYTPHSTWKKKSNRARKYNTILSVFGSDSGKLQTDAVVGFFGWWRYSLACMTYITCIILGVENIFYK